MDKGIELRRLSVGPMDNNVYLLVCRETSEAVLVDAAAEAERILEWASGAHVRYILQTHGHHDHVGALVTVRDALRAPVGAHAADAAMLPAPPDFLLNDGDIISFGNQRLHVIHTPGHTPGGVCFLTWPELISGDTLFPGGPGNTATPLGDFPLIIRSIEEKLFSLPDNTTVWPGHGAPTTIMQEKPHLDEWIARGW